MFTFGWKELAFGRRGNATLGSICLNHNRHKLVFAATNKITLLTPKNMKL